MADDVAEELFKDRCPEAAARQCGVVLAQAAEWALATVEDLEGRKRPGKGDLARHRDIARQLVFHCAGLGVYPLGLGHPCPRLEEAMDALKAKPDWRRS